MSNFHGQTVSFLHVCLLCQLVSTHFFILFQELITVYEELLFRMFVNFCVYFFPFWFEIEVGFHYINGLSFSIFLLRLETIFMKHCPLPTIDL